MLDIIKYFGYILKILFEFIFTMAILAVIFIAIKFGFFIAEYGFEGLERLFETIM